MWYFSLATLCTGTNFFRRAKVTKTIALYVMAKPKKNKALPKKEQEANPVKPSFMDFITAVVKDADKKSAPKKNAE